jgi:predicted Ser/Thr protein kinase
MFARQVVFQTSPGYSHPTALPPINRLAATLTDLLASIANKRLTAKLSPLDATLTKNRGVADIA